MGNKNNNNNEESSPWDILQIDNSTDEKKRNKLAEELFFDIKKNSKNNKQNSAKKNEKKQIKFSETSGYIFTKSNKAKKDIKLAAVNTSNSFIDKLKKKSNNVYKKIINYRISIETLKLNLVLGTILCLIGFFYWVISPSSMVQNIKVNGSDTLTNKEIIAATKIKKNRSIFGILMHENQIENTALKNNNQIKNIKVSVKSPTKVEIFIKEATKVGYILKNNNYYLVLDGGQVLNQAPTVNNLGLPIYDNFSNEKMFKQVISDFAKLDAPIRGAVSEVKYAPNKADNERIILYMNDGNQVIARASTFADKTAYYPSIAAQMDKPGIVNLEVGAFSYSYEQIEINKKKEEDKRKKELEEKKLAEQKIDKSDDKKNTNDKEVNDSKDKHN